MLIRTLFLATFFTSSCMNKQANKDSPSETQTETTDVAIKASEDAPAGDQLYLSAIESVTKNLSASRNDNFERFYCEMSKTQLANYETYVNQISDQNMRGFAINRFKPFLEFVNRKSCQDFGIQGDVNAYRAEAAASTPAADFLSGTTLLQSIVDRSSTMDSLLQTWNDTRRTLGMDAVVVADYPNSIVGGTSTIILIPGWPERPQLHQWLQVQRTVGSMFFIALEPQSDGTYASYMRSSPMRIENGLTVIASNVIAAGGSTGAPSDGTLPPSDIGPAPGDALPPPAGGMTGGGGGCLGCHYSSKPLRMRADEDPLEAAKVQTLVGYLQSYPAETHHPVYNPVASFPGIGTGGNLSLDEASAYAGRTLTSQELVTINRNTACDRCHNGSYQNRLQPPFGGTVEILMQNGFMQPGLAQALSDADRTEAIKVMSEAYKTKLQKYFLGKD